MKNRNYHLDYLKGIACLSVVYFHTFWNVYVGNVSVTDMVKPLFRWAIPIFAMTSGYYCFDESREALQRKLPGKIKHIFFINVIGCMFWFICQLLIGLLGDSHGGFAYMLDRAKGFFTWELMRDWLLYNQDPFVLIMWFTSALLYVYILMLPINKWNLYKIAYILIPVTLACHIWMGPIKSFMGLEVNGLHYRNWAFFIFPFFMMGHLIRNYRDKFLEAVPCWECVLFIIVGEVLTLGEWFLIGKQEMHLGTIPVAIGLFIIAIQKPEKHEKSFITYIGNKLSLFVYIVHMAVKIAIDKYEGNLAFTDVSFVIYSIMRPFIIMALTVVAGMTYYKLKEIVFGREKKHA